MLEKDKRRNNYFSIDGILEEAKEYCGNGEPTAKEVLEFMVGDSEHLMGGDYVVYKYSKPKKRNFVQRINMLWVYPLFIITIPLQYLFLGDWGLNRNTKVGKIVDWLVKFN